MCVKCPAWTTLSVSEKSLRKTPLVPGGPPHQTPSDVPLLRIGDGCDEKNRDRSFRKEKDPQGSVDGARGQVTHLRRPPDSGGP